MSNTRRTFVLGAMSAATLAAQSSRYASRLRLAMDGVATFDFVRWNPFLNPQPDFSQLPPGEIRVRNVFPHQQRDVIETLVYLRQTTGVIPISLIYSQVEDVSVEPNLLALSGKVIANPITSPFGLITGRPVTYSGSYDKTGSATRFEFFAGLVAGSHVTIVPEAFGSLEIQGSPRSF